MKTKFYCNGLRSVHSAVAETIDEAAQMFADRAARREFGKRGYARTCTMGACTEDGRLAEFGAFIGITTGRNETTGRNINFTVYRG